MTARTNLIVVVGFALACSGLVLMGHMEPQASWASLLAIWNDVIRDADDFGLQLTTVPDRDEVALGDSLASKIDQQWPNDADASRYVSEVAAALTPHVERRSLPWHFHVVRWPQANAFALPGGQIYLTEQMLSFTHSEAELAFVLAHEIAHVDRRHCIRRYQYEVEMNRIGLGTAGGAADLARIPMEIGYSKYQEMDADAEAARITADAGYDPHAGVSLMLRLAAGEKALRKAGDTPGGEAGDATVEALRDYLASHPASAERAAAVREQLAAAQRRLAGGTYASGEENLKRRIPVARRRFPR